MKFFSKISLEKQSFKNYESINPKLYRSTKSLASSLKGIKIIHINSSSDLGGGVAELLNNQIPLEKDLGLKSEWLVLKAEKSFFEVTKKIHNFLQGSSGVLSASDKKEYLDVLSKSGIELSSIIERRKEKVVLVLHDPQPLFMINFISENIPTISRLHIDLSTPNDIALNFLKPSIQKANRVIVSNKKYKPSFLSQDKLIVSYPAINPFSEKNKSFPPKITKNILEKLGINMNNPVVSQISRFDKWKDPLGVIEAYYIAKQKIPDLQLILKGSMNISDDPESEKILKKIKVQVKDDPNVFLITNKAIPSIKSETLVNAIQKESNIIIQKSIREGFGLSVTEAMWKGKAVIGGNALGIKEQIENGKNGYIVKSPSECAEKIIKLINNKSLADKLGKNAKETVKEKFLMDKLIYDFLKMYSDLLG